MLNKRLIVLFLILVAFVALCGAIGFACADTGEGEVVVKSVNYERILPQDYYEFDNILAVRVSSKGNIVIIDETTSGIMLKVIGIRERSLPLASIPPMLTVFKDFVIGKFDSQTLSEYGISDNGCLAIYGIIEDKFYPTFISSDLFDVAVDESEGVLFTLSRQEVNSYSLNTQENLTIAPQSSYDFPNDFDYVPKRIAAADNQVYLYSIASSNVFKLESNMITKVENLENIQIAHLCIYGQGLLISDSEGVYLNALNNKILSREDSSKKDSDFLEIADISVQNDKIYIADNLSNAIKVFAGSEFVTMYGSYGSGNYRLNNPASLHIYEDRLLVADSGNNRVLEYDINNTALISELKSLVPVNARLALSNADGVYVAKSDKLYYYANNIYKESYSFEGEIVGVAATDEELFVATADAVWKKEGNEFVELIAANAPIKGIVKGTFGNALYIHCGDKIVSYYKEGVYSDAFIDLQAYSIESVHAFSADYCGNIYLAAQNKIYKFERLLQSYELVSIHQLEGVKEINALQIGPGQNIFISAAHSLIRVVDIPVATQENSSWSNPTIIEYPIRIAKGKGLLQSAPNNYEDTVYLKDDTYLMVFDSAKTYQQVEYLFVEYQGKTMYIPKSNCIIMDSEPKQDLYVRCLFDSVNIYQYPSGTAEIIFASLTYEDIIEVNSSVAVLEGEDVWGWYQVVYEGKLGYVQTSSVVSAENPHNVVIRHYAKAKSSHFGALIPIYSEPSVEAEILEKISDGTTVELTAPLDSDSAFSEVRINGSLGYILTENIVERGLTDGQILAIVLSVITLVASIVLVLMFQIFKKQNP